MRYLTSCISRPVGFIKYHQLISIEQTLKYAWEKGTQDDICLCDVTQGVCQGL